MADEISFIDPFPVRFNNTDDSCLDCVDEPFCQLAQWDDLLFFAWNPATDDFPITNGTFTGSLAGWTAGSGWTYNSDKARLTNDTGVLSQNIGHAINRKYKVSFDISNFSGTGGMDVYLGGQGPLSPSLITGNGSYTFYIIPSTSGDLEFFSFTDTITLDLDNVVVEVVHYNYAISLYNLDSGVYSNRWSSPTFGHPNVGPITFNQYWSYFGLNEVTFIDGCYKIVLIDLHNDEGLITNGTFTGSATGWTIVGNFFDSPFSYSSNHILYNFTGAGPGTGYVYQDIVGLSDGESYFVFFTVTGNLVMEVGDNSNTYVQTSGSGNYMYSALFDPLNPAVVFRVTISPPGPFTTTFDNVVVIRASDVNIFSECYNVKTLHECSNTIIYSNADTNGFGIPYYQFKLQTGFDIYHVMRVESDIRNSDYKGEGERYIDSGGNDILYYFKNRKLKDFFIGRIPEYMHDAISIAIGHKIIKIGPVVLVSTQRYTIEDFDYTPEWDKNTRSKLASSQLLIGKYTQDEKSID